MVEKDLIDKIIAYESGELDNNETLNFFSTLIKSGLCYKLQGHYGRTAEAIIAEGYLDREGKRLTDEPIWNESEKLWE